MRYEPPGYPRFGTIFHYFGFGTQIQRFGTQNYRFGTQIHCFGAPQPPQLGPSPRNLGKIEVRTPSFPKLHPPLLQPTEIITQTTLSFATAATTAARILESSAAAEIPMKQDAIQAEFDKRRLALNALADMVLFPPPPAASVPNWLDPVKFPSELSIDPSRITKVHDWADVILNAFGVGPGHDTALAPENIQDMLYAIQSWKARSDWDDKKRGTVENVKMTRVALSPDAAYYEGEWGSGVDIYKTTDGETFELWMHEYEQYPSCYPQLIKGKLSEGPNKGKKFVYLAWDNMMCTKARLPDGSVCWVADKSKKIPDEVREMEQECE